MYTKKTNYAFGGGKRRRRSLRGFGDDAGVAAAWADVTGMATGAAAGGATPAPTPSFWDKIGSVLTAGLAPQPTMPLMPVAQTGMSTTTQVALAGGAVLLAVLLLRRS